MPQGQRQLSQISGLAAQFGLAVPSGESGFSAAVYADLITSDDVVGRVSQDRYATVHGDSVTLLDLLNASGDSPALRRARAIRMMGPRLRSSVNTRTGVVAVSVTLVDPLVAKQVVEHVIAAVVRFNVERRQSQASAERRFTEHRLAEAQDSLSTAEADLGTFLKRNRDFRSSPDLTLEQDRLNRKVLMRQQVYTTLAQSYEQAKIEEVRDTPVITVLQPAEEPVLPDSRRTAVKTALGLAVGFALGVLIVLLQVTAERRRLAGENDAEDLLLLLHDVRGALRLKKGP
jgi:uncharacterized protein involved in exopolysaccharide biosynthesis